jgi:hypothetical protein
VRASSCSVIKRSKHRHLKQVGLSRAQSIGCGARNTRSPRLIANEAVLTVLRKKKKSGRSKGREDLTRVRRGAALQAKRAPRLADMETVRWVLGPCGATQVERHAAEVTVHGVEVRGVVVDMSLCFFYSSFPPRVSFHFCFSCDPSRRGAGSRETIPRSLSPSARTRRDASLRVSRNAAARGYPPKRGGCRTLHRVRSTSRHPITC